MGLNGWVCWLNGLQRFPTGLSVAMLAQYMLVLSADMPATSNSNMKFPSLVLPDLGSPLKIINVCGSTRGAVEGDMAGVTVFGAAGGVGSTTCAQKPLPTRTFCDSLPKTRTVCLRSWRCWGAPPVYSIEEQLVLWGAPHVFPSFVPKIEQHVPTFAAAPRPPRDASPPPPEPLVVLDDIDEEIADDRFSWQRWRKI